MTFAQLVLAVLVGILSYLLARECDYRRRGL
jgi:hypothetical protein